MDAEVILKVRLRLNGVRDLDHAMSLSRHLLETGARLEATTALPDGVQLVAVECGAVEKVSQRNLIA